MHGLIHRWQNEEIKTRFLPAASARTGKPQWDVTVVLDMSMARLGEMMSSASRSHIANFLGNARI